MNTVRFNELEVSAGIQKAVADMGYDEATPIQAACIPVILQGRDVIGHSQTGTGKTAAFGIPAIEKVDTSDRHVQVLILCPTRELAVQATDEIRKFAKYMQGVKTVCVYGGQPIDRQILSLKTGPQIVVGTPGRVMDHMRRRTLRLNHLNMVVLDEADEMLNMGFRDDIETILADVPEEKQMLLFSATMSKEILAITKRYQHNPEMIKVVAEEKTVPNIKQYFYEVSQGKKLDALTRLLDLEEPKLAVIFCNTKKQVDELTTQLQHGGYRAEGLHGDMRQVARTQVMNGFKKGKINLLVATDVAARGIDVSGVEAVFNYDIPLDPEYYVHRIGRTARAGKSGTSHTLAVGRKQLGLLKMIENYTRVPMKHMPVPAQMQVKQRKIKQYLERTERILSQGNLEEYLELVHPLLEQYSPASVAAALLKLNFPDYQQNYIKTVTKDTVKVRFSIGRNEKICPKHIVGAVAELCDIPGKKIGSIDIYHNYTLMEIPAELERTVLAKMQNKRINGKTVTVQREI